MSDDGPSNGELGRLIVALQTRVDSRFAEVVDRLNKVVSQDVYAIQSTHVEQRLAQLQADIQKVRDDRDSLEDAFESFQRREGERRDRERQQRLYSATIPILIAVVSGAIAIW